MASAVNRVRFFVQYHIMIASCTIHNTRLIVSNSNTIGSGSDRGRETRERGGPTEKNTIIERRGVENKNKRFRVSTKTILTPNAHRPCMSKRLTLSVESTFETDAGAARAYVIRGNNITIPRRFAAFRVRPRSPSSHLSRGRKNSTIDHWNPFNYHINDNDASATTVGTTIRFTRKLPKSEYVS